MANLEFDRTLSDVDAARRAARHSLHVHRAQTMLIAAGLASMGVVAVAGALLASFL